MGWTTRAAFAAVGMAALAQGAEAQQVSPQTLPAAAEGVKKFEPAFFARYAPVTAYDMVRQIPGFSIDNGDSLRGFGATAGNVLIDGQRPSSKNGISDELARISARDVARIELIGASAAGDIDVRGFTELANVVLKPASEMQTSSTWQGDVALFGGRVSVRGAGTRQWKTHDLSVRLNAAAFQRTQIGDTFIEERNTAGALTATRDEHNIQTLGELQINATVNWTPSPRDAVNFTGRLMPRAYQTNASSLRYDPAGAPLRVSLDDYTEKDILHAELGGDWEHKFSPQNSLKLISVNRAVSWRPQDFFQTPITTGTPSAQTNNTDLKSGEHVLRGVWTLKPNEQHTVEMGLEGAFNYLDQASMLAVSTNGGPFAPQVQPTGTTRVEEVRGEGSINDTWRIDPKLTLELGFTYEASRITQTIPPSTALPAGTEQEREFSYPKPRAVATWTPAKEDQIRASIERTVAQLSFGEFASNIVPIEGLLTEGNPDLKPAQTWETSLQWKHQIGQRGSVSVRGYYHQIEDTQDLIPIRPPITGCAPGSNASGCVFTAAGNIGDGTRYGVELTATYPLDDFGIKGGILKFSGEVSDSEVTDPITGEKRRINSESTYNWNIDFRQDIPEWKMSWGGDYSDEGDYDSFRLNEERHGSVGPGDFDMFVETTAIQGMTVRLSAENIGNQPEYLDRRFFSPNRFPGGTFSGSEHRVTTAGIIWQLTASGTF